MKQVTQTQRNGRIRIEDVPPPALRPGGALVRTAYSLISAGTERAKLELARKSLVGKAQARPEQARQVLEVCRQQGPLATYRKVLNRMEALDPLGYSCSGLVIAAGLGTDGLAAGDAVACAGGGYANHAEVNFVPMNLCVKVPEGVTLEAAAFSTVGAVALQGVRQADVRLGEAVVVIGLGLVGQITVQLLKAAGCLVIGLDPAESRCSLARQLGAHATASDDSLCSRLVAETTSGYGADAVIITAVTQSSKPVIVAGAFCRERGRVVVVGEVGMELPRKPYYNKELELRLSRSYGPGRYDPRYEEQGIDYPYGYVRWTEKRNMESFLSLVAQGRIDVAALVTHRFKLEAAEEAYDLIVGKKREPFLAVLFEYPDAPAPKACIQTGITVKKSSDSGVRLIAGDRDRIVTVGLIGAGNFAQDTLIPALNSMKDVRLKAVATASGLSARSAAKRFGFETCLSDPLEIMQDPSIHAVAIATRHNSHAPLVVQALDAGKNVFVEKPLALDGNQLATVVAAYESALARRGSLILMVGFNRRFAPYGQEIKRFFSGCSEPLLMHYRVNAGFVSGEHWSQDAGQGGGRVMGEVCHFADWLMFLANSPPVQVYARALPNQGVYHDDNLVVTISFANGSLGSILYYANGDKRIGKERIEVTGGGRMAILDDFRLLTLSGGGTNKTSKRRFGQDKGHRNEMQAFTQSVLSGGPCPVPFEEIVATTRVTFAILESIKRRAPVDVPCSVDRAPED